MFDEKGSSSVNDSKNKDDSKMADVIPMHERRGKVGRPQRGGQNPEKFKEQSSEDRYKIGVRKYLDGKKQSERKARKYQPEDFHVAVSDENGHDVKSSGRFHPAMWNEMNLIISRHNFPFDTVWDLIRVACLELMRDLYELEREEGGVQNYLPMLQAINQLSKQSKARRDFADTTKHATTELDQMISDGKEGEAARFLYDFIANIKQIPQKEYREPTLEFFEGKYGWLTKKKARSVKLRVVRKRKHDEEEDE